MKTINKNELIQFNIDTSVLIQLRDDLTDFYENITKIYYEKEVNNRTKKISKALVQPQNRDTLSRIRNTVEEHYDDLKHFLCDENMDDLKNLGEIIKKENDSVFKVMSDDIDAIKEGVGIIKQAQGGLTYHIYNNNENTYLFAPNFYDLKENEFENIIREAVNFDDAYTLIGKKYPRLYILSEETINKYRDEDNLNNNTLRCIDDNTTYVFNFEGKYKNDLLMISKQKENSFFVGGLEYNNFTGESSFYTLSFNLKVDENSKSISISDSTSSIKKTEKIIKACLNILTKEYEVEKRIENLPKNVNTTEYIERQRKNNEITVYEVDISKTTENTLSLKETKDERHTIARTSGYEQAPTVRRGYMRRPPNSSLDAQKTVSVRGYVTHKDKYEGFSIAKSLKDKDIKNKERNEVLSDINIENEEEIER